jgi:undecaprenyl-diphosphatase
MQVACVFYGWFLLTNLRSWLRFTLIFLMVGIGFGLIYNRYHNIYDVSGAVFFAFTTIGLYRFSLFYLKGKTPNLSAHLIALIPILVSAIALAITSIFFYQLTAHSIMALYSILGISAGLLFSENLGKFGIRITHLSLVIIALLAIAYLFSNIKFEILFLQQLKWFFISTTLPFLQLLVQKLNLKRTKTDL